jgi:AcrR family transcriptional regulator
MDRSQLLPAPGRGAYDRSLSRSERHAEHRERLLLAAAEVLKEGAPTIAKIVERAGVSRSTFYEFFDSPEHILAQLEQRAVKSLEAALGDAMARARTPLERVRAVVRAWLEVIEAQRSEALVALTRRVGNELLSPAAQALLNVLGRLAQAGRADGASSLSATDDVSLLAAAAAVEAVSRRHLLSGQLRDAPRTLSDIISKLLR